MGRDEFDDWCKEREAEVQQLRSRIKDAEEVIWALEAFIKETHRAFFPILAAYRKKWGDE